MKPFELLRPADLPAALAMLRSHAGQARVIAGGTDLLTQLRAGTASCPYLVDLAGLGLAGIREEGGEIRIGALTTFSAIMQSHLIQTKLPVLAAAASQVGATQTRSLATIGGNLCTAVPSLDSAPPLLVLGAKLRLAGVSGERVMPVEEFFTGPRKTVLQPDELLAEVIIPVPGPDFGASFIKHGRRKALTLAIVNAAASLSLSANGAVAGARIALGAVAPTPVRAQEAEAMLVGQLPTPDLLAAATKAAAGATRPISDLRASATYRLHLSEVLVRRCLEAAWRAASGGGGACA